MTRTDRSATARLAAWCLLVACLLCPVRVLSADSARTLALVDFALRAPESSAAESVWLGPALSELVQAKLQLFGGVRVLERTRVQVLLRDADVDGATAEAEPAVLAGIIPAEVLIAGSVSIDAKDPRRIRVQVRAFEVETSKIVSEATFSGIGDLSGLLKIAEDLARTLAVGLKLSFTPEHLAYAEPVKIETLRLFVAGEVHLAAGRHREAIAAFQKALEGNEGRYYAAAHRLQGEAYQSLAKSLDDAGSRKVREEYLKKFKEDALAGSGVLYDLGLAYESNGLWKEAAGAFGDYLGNLGTEGARVRWTFDLGRLRTSENEPQRLKVVEPDLRVMADGSVFLLATAAPGRGGTPAEGRGDAYFFLVKIDGDTGQQVRDFPLNEALNLEKRPLSKLKMRLLNAFEDRVLLGWNQESEIKGKVGECLATGVAVVDLKRGTVVWQWELGLPNREVSAGYLRDTMAYAFFERDLTAERDAFLVAFDALTGTRLSQVAFSPELQRLNEHNLIGLDLTEATFINSRGEIDLRTGEPLPTPAAPPGEYLPLPTGVVGIRYVVTRKGIAFYQGGRRVAFFDGWRLEPLGRREPRFLHQGPFILGPHESTHTGLLVVSPSSWEAVHILGEQSSRVAVWGRGERYIRLEVRAPDDGSGGDPRFGLPQDGGQFVHVVYDPVAGTLQRSGATLRGSQFHDHGDGSEVLVREGNELRQTLLLPRGSVGTLWPGEARLHRAAAFLAAGDPAAASQEIDVFEKDFPGHGGAILMRMRIALAQGDEAGAAQRALLALRWLRLQRREIDECVSALRLTFPAVRDAIASPYRVGPLEPKTVTPRGEAVFANWESKDRIRHLIVDPRRGTSRTLTVEKIEDVLGGTWTYDGKYLAGRIGAGHHREDSPRYVLVDLESGERTITDKLPFVDPTGLLRGDSCEALQVGADFVVYADPMRFTPQGSATVSVLSRGDGREITRLDLPLENEIIAGAAVDQRWGLVVAVSGGDHEAYISGRRGTWFRVELFPFGTSGARWTYEVEGWIAGSPIFEGDYVVIPAYEGKVPQLAGEDTGQSHPRLRLTRISLEARTGRKVLESPLQGSPKKEFVRPESDSPWYSGAGYVFSLKSSAEKSAQLVLSQHGGALQEVFAPWPRRCLYPGLEFTLREEGRNCSFWWFFAAEQPPVPLLSDPRESNYRIIRRYNPFGQMLWKRLGYEEVVLMVWKDFVLEAYGGVVLVMDYADGRGLRSITWGP